MRECSYIGLYPRLIIWHLLASGDMGFWSVLWVLF